MYLPLGNTHEEGSIFVGIIQFYQLSIPTPSSQMRWNLAVDEGKT